MPTVKPAQPAQKVLSVNPAPSTVAPATPVRPLPKPSVGPVGAQALPAPVSVPAPVQAPLGVEDVRTALATLKPAGPSVSAGPQVMGPASLTLNPQPMAAVDAGVRPRPFDAQGNYIGGQVAPTDSRQDGWDAAAAIAYNQSIGSTPVGAEPAYLGGPVDASPRPPYVPPAQPVAPLAIQPAAASVLQPAPPALQVTQPAQQPIGQPVVPQPVTAVDTSVRPRPFDAQGNYIGGQSNQGIMQAELAAAQQYYQALAQQETAVAQNQLSQYQLQSEQAEVASEQNLWDQQRQLAGQFGQLGTVRSGAFQRQAARSVEDNMRDRTSVLSGYQNEMMTLQREVQQGIRDRQQAQVAQEQARIRAAWALAQLGATQ